MDLRQPESEVPAPTSFSNVRTTNERLALRVHTPPVSLTIASPKFRRRLCSAAYAPPRSGWLFWPPVSDFIPLSLFRCAVWYINCCLLRFRTVVKFSGGLCGKSFEFEHEEAQWRWPRYCDHVTVHANASFQSYANANAELSLSPIQCI